MEIQLTKGKMAFVCKKDYKNLMKYKWHAVNKSSKRRVCLTYYAVTTLSNPKRDVSMHRLIMGVTDRCIEVDHVDGNPLNNYRRNLRLATHQQNSQNRHKMSRQCSSQFIGVSWMTKRREYIAKIKTNGKMFTLGYFKDEYKAGKAYNIAAKRIFGKFAKLNKLR